MGIEWILSWEMSEEPRVLLVLNCRYCDGNTIGESRASIAALCSNSLWCMKFRFSTACSNISVHFLMEISRFINSCSRTNIRPFHLGPIQVADLRSRIFCSWRMRRSDCKEIHVSWRYLQWSFNFSSFFYLSDWSSFRRMIETVRRAYLWKYCDFMFA